MMYLLLVVLGLGLGSFVNALVWRTRQQLTDDGEPKKLTKKQKQELSILTGRSMCPYCKQQLRPKDLVPVFSWLWLRGKCHACQKPISWQYPFIELFMGLLFAASYAFWPLPLTGDWHAIVFASWLVAVVGLVALMVYDIKWMLVPNRIVYPLATITAVLMATTFLLGRPVADLGQIAFAILIGGGLFWLVYQISAGKWIGYGDVRLGLYLGLLVARPNLAFLTLFFASILGTLTTAPLLLSKKISKTTRIPFGPFLVAGAFIAMLWGQQLIDWYIGTMVGL